MKCSYFVTFLIVCAAYSAIDSSSAESILDKCVNKTLVLGEACKAIPQAKSFRDFQSSIEKDVALIVLTLAIPDVHQHSRYEHRFDLVKTTIGEFLLTLKSQMEFLTIDLPLLSDKVDRRYVELVPYPPGCVTNITVNDTLVQNWLLCVLTKETDGIETLSVNKLCIAKQYKEPNDWYLFNDTYYDECTNTPSIHSAWFELKEDENVSLFRWFVNYGVSIITITFLVIFAIYRHVHNIRERVFLYKLQNPRTEVCRIFECSDVESDTVELSPDELDCTICNCKKPKRCKFYCTTYRKTEMWKRCHRIDSKCRRPEQWDHIEENGKSYQLKITGFWLVAMKNDFISYSSFGLLDLLQICIVELASGVFSLLRKCFRLFRFNSIKVVLSILVTEGMMYLLYKHIHTKLFYTLTDVIICCLISLLMQGVAIFGFICCYFNSKNCCCEQNKLCRNQYDNIIWFIDLLTAQTFYFLAFLLLTILSRVTVVLYFGLKFKSESNLYSLVSLTVFFILTNGYYQLQKTHERYLTFFDKCMAEIKGLVDESRTLKEPVFTKRIVSSDNGEERWPEQNEKKLILTFNSPVLLYMSNGGLALNRSLFLHLCQEDTLLSPGSFRCTAIKDFLKFIFWGGVVAVIIYLQHVVGKQFDSSLYSQAPSTVLGGLIPLLLRFVFSSGHTQKENANFTRLVNDAAIKFSTHFRVIDFKMDDESVCIRDDDPTDVWQKICIKKKKCAGCCCLQREAKTMNNDKNKATNAEQSEDEGNQLIELLDVQSRPGTYNSINLITQSES